MCLPVCFIMNESSAAGIGQIHLFSKATKAKTFIKKRLTSLICTLLLLLSRISPFLCDSADLDRLRFYFNWLLCFQPMIDHSDKSSTSRLYCALKLHKLHAETHARRTRSDCHPPITAGVCWILSPVIFQTFQSKQEANDHKCQ